MPIRDANGDITRWIGTNTDIQDQRNATEELAHLNATLEQQVEARTRERDRVWRTSRDLFVIIGFDGRYRSVNPAWTEALGYTAAELIGLKVGALAHPEDAASVAAAHERLVALNVVRDFDVRLRAKDGSYRLYSWHCIPEDGEIYAAGRDITERRLLEEQLRQSQKMEAVGQLTGGLAHDFNNLLTGITGSLELLQTRLAQGRLNDLDRYITAAQGASKRAAALTHRLLAFSRRQTLEPQAHGYEPAGRRHGGTGPAHRRPRDRGRDRRRGRTVEHARRPEPARERAAQPVHQRPRRDAGWRARDDRDRQPVARPAGGASSATCRPDNMSRCASATPGPA